MADGLWLSDTKVFSRLIKDSDNDSLFRLNHYPYNHDHGSSKDRDTSPPSLTPPPAPYHHSKVGIGAHTDPQILTLLRSNDVGGLQISIEDKVWVPVPPDPTAFCVNVGDLLQVPTLSFIFFSLINVSW